MLRVTKAILHVFDFETGTKYFSQSTLDLEDRQTKSYVQRRLRKITANPEFCWRSSGVCSRRR